LLQAAAEEGERPSIFKRLPTDARPLALAALLEADGTLRAPWRVKARLIGGRGKHLK